MTYKQWELKYVKNVGKVKHIPILNSLEKAKQKKESQETIEVKTV